MRAAAILVLLALGGIGGGLALAVPTQEAMPSAAALLAPGDAKAALARATRESRLAEARAARLTRVAETATETAQRTTGEAAALAARIQQAEADIEVARARLTIATSARAGVTARLAARQEPTARLAAALQTAARRPLALAALQPGSLEDVVHLRAVLGSTVPQIHARTAALRSELERGRAFEAQAARALAELREGETALRQRRNELAALEQQQRLASRAARSASTREAERALGLAEQARDLDALVGRLDALSALRRELAALPGPMLRPADLAAAAPLAAAPAALIPAPASAAPPGDF